MPETPRATPVSAPPPPAPRFLPWWLPGLILGFVAAIAAAPVVLWSVPTHRAEATLQWSASEPDAIHRYRIAVLRSPDLIARVVADPQIAELPSVRASKAPVSELASRLTVTEISPGFVTVTLTGTDPDDLKVILDHLVKRFLDETVLATRADLDSRLRKYESLAEVLQNEIDARKKQIELLGRAHNTTGGVDNAQRLATLQKRFVDADGEYARLGREITKLEAEIRILKTQLADNNHKIFPDPVIVEQAVNSDPLVIKAKSALDEKKNQLAKAIEVSNGSMDAPAAVELKKEVEKLQKGYDERRKTAQAEATEQAIVLERAKMQIRVTQLATALEIKKEEQDKLKEERDSLQKLITSGVGGGLDIDAMRQTLEPQQQQLQKLNMQIVELRLEAQMGNRIAIRGNVTASPLQTGLSRALTVGISATVAFTGGFIFATGFSFVGLLFHVFRRFA